MSTRQLGTSPLFCLALWPPAPAGSALLPLLPGKTGAEETQVEDQSGLPRGEDNPWNLSQGPEVHECRLGGGVEWHQTSLPVTSDYSVTWLLHENKPPPLRQRLMTLEITGQPRARPHLLGPPSPAGLTLTAHLLGPPSPTVPTLIHLPAVSTVTCTPAVPVLSSENFKSWVCVTNNQSPCHAFCPRCFGVLSYAPGDVPRAGPLTLAP